MPRARTNGTRGDRRGQPQRPAERQDRVTSTEVRLGLHENRAQFTLLVAVNAFVGAMVGLERSTLPIIGRQDFGLASDAAVLSFIVAFGIAVAASIRWTSVRHACCAPREPP